MSKYIIKKCPLLEGQVEISGAKNAVLPILAACILTEKECVINSVPPLADVFVMLEILKSLGAEVSYDQSAKKAKRLSVFCGQKRNTTLRENCGRRF